LGGDPPTEPRKGFGTRLIEGLMRTLGGSLERKLESEGLTITLTFPTGLTE
jgi:two-component sensor histidine kinase